MESEHTPGPWILSKYTNHEGFSVWANDRGCIAERWYDVVQDAPYGGEIEANGRLLAASPDLFDACQALLECWYGGGERTESEDVRMQCRAYELARAAITKAEGSTK